jgi:nucleotide-binding universal stress UspA family protein
LALDVLKRPLWEDPVISPKHILVATDFSEASDAALRYGRSFARTYGATLHVLHVVDDIATRATELSAALASSERMQLELEQQGRARLEALLDEEDRRDLHARPIVITSPAPAQSILAYAGEHNVDLIIIGTHGRSGLARLFMGSVAQHVVRLAPCPVLTVRHPEREFVLPDALQTVTTRPEPTKH